MSVYSLRRAFLECPSLQWSGSAGAIYPLVERLERAKLLVSSDVAQGLRKSKEYSVTEEGQKVARVWLSPPFDAEMVSVSQDALRDRLLFLGVIDAEHRQTWFARAAELLDAVEVRIDSWEADNKDLCSKLYASMGRKEVAFRREMLRDAELILSSGEVGG